MSAYAGWPDQSPSTAFTAPRLPTPEPAYASASVLSDLLPRAGRGQPEAVALVGHRGEVGDADQVGASPAPRRTNEKTLRPASLASIHGKPRRVVVARPQRRRVDGTTRFRSRTSDVHAAVLGVVEQPPVELAGLGPLRLLAELGAHEEQLLAGVRPHEGEVGAQVGQLLPPVARHLAQQRALAVHDLVVADRAARSSPTRRRPARRSSRRGGRPGAPGRAACSRACRASSPCST